MSNARSRLAAYGRTPKALLRDGAVRPIAKIVYALIDEVAGHEDITVERLGEWLGVNAKTARRALHEIRDAGWVEVVEVVTGSGQRPSMYVANAYSFQHLSEPLEDSSPPQPTDQGEHPGDQGKTGRAALPKTGSTPSQKVPSTPGDGAHGTDRAGEGSQKVVAAGGYQKAAAPTYLRDDETPPSSPSTDDGGFREFWARYPDTGYKGRKEECRRIWKSMPIEDRRDTWYALGAYLNSELWMNREKIPSPLNWLESEPALALRGRNLPPQRLSPQNEWMRNG